jgi:diguanylate cyclase (GGDEF)-like protein
MQPVTSAEQAPALRFPRTGEMDAVTGIPPRKALDEDLPRLLNHFGGKIPLAALMVDIDHFKKFNDKWGHAIGDRVLRHVGSLLRSCVLHRGEVYRYGGEEMTVLLFNCSSQEGLAAAERFCSLVSSSPLVLGRDDPSLSGIPARPGEEEGSVSLGVTISVGVCTTEGLPGSELIVMADRALYSAKDSGRNRAVLYEKKIERYEKLEPVEVRFPGVSSVFVNSRVFLKQWYPRAGVTNIDVWEMRIEDTGVSERADTGRPPSGLLSSDLPGRVTAVERRGSFTFFTLEVRPDTLDVMYKQASGRTGDGG